MLARRKNTPTINRKVAIDIAGLLRYPSAVSLFGVPIFLIIILCERESSYLAGETTLRERPTPQIIDLMPRRQAYRNS
jgi:hypothetical protein